MMEMVYSFSSPAAADMSDNLVATAVVLVNQSAVKAGRQEIP